ncbi:hypothetical protein HPB48_009573 [Haemaphysalis longicornis]|uniref:Uncharacterized protein n=1 Tax=Haemaphysalis longicornis TaxID=44386 RepID=A0A9J6F6R1_HAELO|nr:hypothetical protein HPB48_009573 [Haemaphysalis longicornis]
MKCLHAQTLARFRRFQAMNFHHCRVNRHSHRGALNSQLAPAAQPILPNLESLKQEIFASLRTSLVAAINEQVISILQQEFTIQIQQHVMQAMQQNVIPQLQQYIPAEVHRAVSDVTTSLPKIIRSTLQCQLQVPPAAELS